MPLTTRHRKHMNHCSKLLSLVPGERAAVAGITAGDDSRRRLRELGLTDGAPVECVLRRGGISAYLINGSLIALRSGDSAAVCTEPPTPCRGGGAEWQ